MLSTLQALPVGKPGCLGLWAHMLAMAAKIIARVPAMHPPTGIAGPPLNPAVVASAALGFYTGT
jgi:hypothetical protein